MKHISKLAAILSAVLFLSLFGMPITAEEEEQDVIKIGSEAEFLNFLSNCSYDAWSKGKVFELTEDINLAGEEAPMAAVFSGTFEGNGHTISGITLESESSPAGLFAILTSEGTIEHLRVSATVTPSGAMQNTGGIVGINYGVINHCTFMGTVKGERNTGGIAGLNASSGMILSSSSSGVIYGQKMTGGIAGCNLGVISASENSAYVNTDSDDTELTVSDISFEFSLDTKSFVSEESTIRRFDTGGIAGYTDGSISLSRNQGTIGYPQVGYNVGGIAGRSDGHILKCTNSGSIFGRKDIGGIVGQAEPYITSNLSASTISTISSELYALEYSVNSLQAHADEAEADLNERVNSLNDYIGSAKEAISSIDLDRLNEEKPDVSAIEFEVPESVDDLKERAESLRSEGRSKIDAAKDVDLRDAEQQVISSVTGLSDQARVLQQEVSGKVSSLVSDADQIAGSIASMQNTLNQAIYELEHPEEFVQDTSDNDPEEVLLGKISSCTNEGDVNGALNTGGIAGTMGIEYTADPEDDVSEELDATTKQHYELKCILEGNVNHGTVSAVRNDVGGIVGKMDLGLVYRSESYGDVSSSSGDNVGGIAGRTASVVRNNWSKCRLSGAQAVGGIVGCGTEGTLSGGASLIDSNVSMAEIEHAEEFSGAISGTDSGTFTNNRFVSDSLNGINGASFAGRAEPVFYEELLETPDVPDEFKTFTLKFVANGEVLKEVSFSYGDSFTANDMPAIPKQDGMYAYYDRTDLTNLHNDTVVTAVYTADLTSLASDETRGSGRAVFYVKGRFEGEDSLHAAAEAQEREQFDVVKDSFWNAALSYLTSPGQGLAFDEIEQWHLEIPDDGAPSHEVRYLLPKTLTGAYQIYLKTNGNWERIPVEEIGSYAVFTVMGNEADLAVIAAVPGWWIYALAGSIILLIVLLILLVRSRGKRKAAREAILSRIAVNRRLQIIIAAVAVFLIAMICAGVSFVRSGVANSARAYQLIKEYAGNRPWVMEGSFSLKAGSDEEEKTFLIQQDDTGITVITVDGLSLYYHDDSVYLENGKAFTAGSLAPDYEQLLECAAILYENAGIRAETDGDATVYRLEAEQEEAEQLLAILLARYADELPVLKSVSLEVREQDGTLHGLSATAAGVLKNEDHTAYDVSAVLTPRDPQNYSFTVPEAVKTAVSSGNMRGTELTSDYLDLLKAWAKLYHNEEASMKIRVRADADEISLDDTFQYHRAWNQGSPISSVQKGSLIVYFNEERMCTEKGVITMEAPLKRLNNAGTLPEILYALSMNSTFDVSAAGDTRVFTIEPDEACIKELVEAMADPAWKDLTSLTSGTVQITLSGSSISRITVILNGTAEVLEEEIPLTLSAECVIDPEGSFTIPDQVRKVLSD